MILFRMTSSNIVRRAGPTTQLRAQSSGISVSQQRDSALTAWRECESETQVDNRRVKQAQGVQWFVRLAQSAAPEFEVYELPRYSLFPLLIRRRDKEFLTPFDGMWSPIQIRSTMISQRHSVVEQLKSGLQAKSGGWYYIRNRSFATHPQVPCVVMSPISSSCFVFSGAESGPSLNTKPGCEFEI
ncbi:unnamed protein product, partial [Amoebophrya sp. A25]|eukprot:GSA25T00027141001.1